SPQKAETHRTTCTGPPRGPGPGPLAADPLRLVPRRRPPALLACSFRDLRFGFCPRVQPACSLGAAGTHQDRALTPATFVHRVAAWSERTTRRDGIQAGHGSIDLSQHLAILRDIGYRGHQA